MSRECLLDEHLKIKQINLHSVYCQLFELANSVHQISQTLHGLSTVWIIWAYGRLRNEETNTLSILEPRFDINASCSYDQYSPGHDSQSNSPDDSTTPGDVGLDFPQERKSSMRAMRERCHSEVAQKLSKKVKQPEKQKPKSLQRKVLQTNNLLKTEQNDRNVNQNDEPKCDLGSYFVCTECSIVFVNESEFIDHVKIHSVVKNDTNKKHTELNSNFNCETCQRTFKTEKGLVLHRRKAHNIKTMKILECDECGKTFEHKNQLESHLIGHSGIPKFSCTVCQKAFLRKVYLTDHLRIHTGERRYQCSQCGMRFGRHFGLKEHERRLHSDVKLFKCSHCPKTFSTKFCLNIHAKRHSGIRDHICERCGKAFYNAKDLNKHKIVHSGMKLFTCRLCGQSFAENGTLKTHIKTRHCQCGEFIKREPRSRVKHRNTCILQQ